MIIVIGSLLSLGTRGLNLGLDFTGGTIVEFASPEAVEPGAVRAALSARGYADATVQVAESGRLIIVRLPPAARAQPDAAERIAAILPRATVQRLDVVGPQVGDEMREDGGLAMLYATGGIVAYLVQRFNWRFSLGATAATLHDALVILGFFSFTGMTFDLAIVAGVLTVVGYSLNDTIVIFDRVRENARRLLGREPVDLFNVSINQTLSRTLITSGTTLAVVLSMFVFGGETLRGFSVALIVGIVSGTYSTLYIASPVTLALGYRGATIDPRTKDAGGVPDERP
jgi:preprotein translocase subunit SecF